MIKFIERKHERKNRCLQGTGSSICPCPIFKRKTFSFIGFKIKNNMCKSTMTSHISTTGYM